MPEEPLDRPLVCCMVLTWNNFQDTDECLRSLHALTYQPRLTVVVDNASTDGSLERLRARWGDSVLFVESGSNHSIPFGYNRGFEEALHLGADYVCQVDNDVVVEPDFIEGLLPAFGHSEVTALASPIILDYYSPGVVWFAGATYSRTFGLTMNHHFKKPLAAFPKVGTTFRTDLAATCAVMISRRALNEVGLLDERLAFSHDDVDWCLRAASLGFECVVVGRPLARHKVSVTRGVPGSHVPGPRASFDMARGAYLVGEKYVRGPGWIPFLFGRLALSLPFQCWRMVSAGAWRSALAYIKGTARGICGLTPAGRSREPAVQYETTENGRAGRGPRCATSTGPKGGRRPRNES